MRRLGEEMMHRLALLVWALSGTVASASSKADWDACIALGDEAIRACSSIVSAPSEPQANIPIALFNRGLAYNARRLFKLAEKDFTAVIHQRPDHAKAYNNRAYSYVALAEAYGSYADRDYLGLALTDFTKAAELDSRYEPNLARFQKQMDAAAAAGLQVVFRALAKAFIDATSDPVTRSDKLSETPPLNKIRGEEVASDPEDKSDAASASGWRVVISKNDLEKLNGMRDIWSHIVPSTLLAELHHADARIATDAALVGKWSCRIVLPDWTYEWFDCRITGNSKRGLLFEKLTGSQRTAGWLYRDSEKRLIYLGSYFSPSTSSDEWSQPSMYDSSGLSKQNEVGVLSQIGSDRLRIEFPEPEMRHRFKIMELELASGIR